MSQPNPDDEDGQDMGRLAGGQDAALNHLMARHAEKLFHYLVRCLHDQGEADDLAQETFAKVYHHRAEFDPRQKFTTWLFTIATNLVRDRYRWRSRHPQVSLDAELADTGNSFRDTLAASGASPDEQAESEERAATVRDAVAALPEELRQPLILAIYQGLPQAQIAEMLNCSVKAVETRIYRARQRLRAALTELLEVS